MRKAITIGLVVLLLISVGFNVILYKAADEEITKLQNQVAELNSTYGGVVVGKNSVNISLDYYDEKPVILKDVLYRGRVIEIGPGYIRYVLTMLLRILVSTLRQRS